VWFFRRYGSGNGSIHLPIISSAGVIGVRSSGSSVTVDSGQLFTIPSISVKRIDIWRNVKLAFPMMIQRGVFTLWTIRSAIPFAHGAFSTLNIHSMFFFCPSVCTFALLTDLHKSLISFETHLKFFALSENMTFGVPRRPKNDRNGT
jgi:hypothetical protein